MARKRPAVPPPLAPRDVDIALQKGDYRKALEVAKRLHEVEPSDAAAQTYAHTLLAAFQMELQLGKVKDSVKTLKLGEQFAHLHPAAAEGVAVMHAQAGEFAKALQLASTPRVTRHVADLCMRRKRAEGVPEQMRADFESMSHAFAAYESGRDDEARERLQAIGLTSPFLEWKVLLRGLIAHAAGDTPRAVENWQRLAAEFQPAKLAAPLRLGIDPSFRASLSREAGEDLSRRAETLLSSDLVQGFKSIQRSTGRDQRLQAVWKQVEAVILLLRARHAHLIPKLGAVLYEAILRQGEPSDLKKHQAHFPRPADDPDYQRLSAMACEAARYFDDAIGHWQKYEAWIATAPPGWPAGIARRARAKILHRIGGIVEDLTGDPHGPDTLDDLFRSISGASRRDRTNHLSPLDYYQRSAKLAPDWAVPVYDVFDLQLKAKSYDAAEATARTLLDRQPDDLAVLDRLANLYRVQRRVADQLRTRLQARAANPLDAKLAVATGLAYLAAIRHHLIEGELAEAERLLVESCDTTLTRYPAVHGSLTIIAALKAGRPQDATDERQRLDAYPAIRMSVAYHLAVDGLLAKLKPAQRKPLDAGLKAVFETPAPHPAEVGLLYAAWAIYQHESVTFRGQPTHEKKILALAEKSLQTSASVEHYEMLVAEVAKQEQHKTLLAMGPRLAARFPTSPLFPFVEAQGLYEKGRGYGIEYRIRNLLDTAKRLAEASAVPSHQRLLEVIEEFRNAMRPMHNFIQLPLFSE